MTLAIVQVRDRSIEAGRIETGLLPSPPHRSVPLEDLTRRATTRTRFKAPAALVRFAGPGVILAAWQLIAGFHLVDPQTLTPPAAIFEAAASLWAQGDLQRHLLASLVRVTWGVSIGVTIGLALALVAGFFRAGEHLVDSSMNMLRMVPVIALLPLIIVWMGIGESAKISLIVAGVVFPVYMNSFAGIRGIDQKLVEAGQAFGLGRWGLIRRVILPGAIPGFLVGLRWALGAAWLLLFFAEQINADRGIGYLINQAQAWNRTDIIILGLVIYGILGLAGDLAVKMIERFALSWRRGFEGA